MQNRNLVSGGVAVVAVLVLVGAWTAVLAQEQAAGVPDWAREHMAGMAEGSGHWIASNVDYQGEDGGIEAFGMEWSWTLGEQGLRGRLFGLRGGEEIGTYWEFRTFWHPGTRQLVAQQFGANGAFGTGTVEQRGDGGVEVIQEFFAPDGSSSRLRHLSRHETGVRHDRSFVWSEGDWVPRREYTWELQPEE